MAVALLSRREPLDPAAAAELHFVLRFAFGTTFAFITCEFMGWQPSVLAPVLTGVLLASLPVAPPIKVGFVLILVMGLCAWFAFWLTSWFHQTPSLLFGIIGFIMFLAFCGLAQAKGQLPLTLLLMCFAVVPVVTLTQSDFAGILPGLLTRSMLLAVIFTWTAFAIWTRPSPKPPDPASAPVENPALVAAIGTVIVLPIMLVYLMFGLTDAIPVLLTTVLLVAKMEEERSTATGVIKLLANFLGGFIAVVAFYLLQIAPSLQALSLITFLIGAGFGMVIVKGGARGGAALLGYNATMVIFGLALLKGTSNSGTWGARVVQFGIACSFAVGMMILLLPLARRKGQQPQR